MTAPQPIRNVLSRVIGEPQRSQRFDCTGSGAPSRRPRRKDHHMGSIATFLPGLAEGSLAVDTGSDVVDGAAGIFGEILNTIGGFIAEATGSLSE